MKGRITENGCLDIMRKGKYESQICVYSSGKKCADHCPLFSELKLVKDKDGQDTKTQSLKICQDRVLFFDELIDERV